MFTLTKQQARRFMLAHHSLWPPRALSGKQGVLAFIEHAGCIQYDPINVVGRNPDLVLQARIRDYQPVLLESLLYEDRLLLDGWDKLASIYLARDWPYFSRYRADIKERYNAASYPVLEIAPFVRQELTRRGPLSSIDLEHTASIDWMWGRPVRQVRAVLELLFAMGEVGIHHRINTRRYFDFMERVLSPEVFNSPDPNDTIDAYHDWHVLRRVGGLGLASSLASDCWLGIFSAKTPERRAAMARLIYTGSLIEAALENNGKQTVFLRAGDLPVLENVMQSDPPPAQATFLAPLDNLLWDRNMLRLLFDFDYTWEVYKPAHQRKYAYYVLPVLYGDQFIARMDSGFDRKTSSLVVRNWWWEPNIQTDRDMLAALDEALLHFGGYLGAKEIRLEEAASEKIKLL